jgi:glucose/arabinose dehydrogenase
MPMHTSIRYVSTLAALVSTAISCTSDSHAVLTVETIATGFTSPVHVTAPPGDSSRLFVVQQAGLIRIVDLSDNSILATPFLDITGPVVSGGERGLFALAFHPDYASNGYFFVHYTGAGGHTVVSRFAVSGNPNVANAASEVKFFELTQPQGNHNGGMIGFRPGEAGNYLYIALGDGGGSGDPNDLAQNITNAYGTILRLDVDAGPGPDTSTPNVPSTNPFVGTAGSMRFGCTVCEIRGGSVSIA